VGPLAAELLRYAAGCGAEEFIFQRKDGGDLDDICSNTYSGWRPWPWESTSTGSVCTGSAGST
jgi:hypothetical protein